MKQIFKKDSQMYQFFTDYYKWMQLFAIPEDNDRYWSLLIESSDKLYKKYEKNEFCSDLIVSYIKRQKAIFDAMNTIKHQQTTIQK